MLSKLVEKYNYNDDSPENTKTLSNPQSKELPLREKKQLKLAIANNFQKNQP